MIFAATLTLLFGSAIGLSLGLTGGGGAIFAVPLLVYGLGLPAREAIGVSLITVGFTGALGFLQRARAGQVEFATGIVFAVAGIVGAPLGALIAGQIPELLLMALFSGLMLVIAIKMWTASITHDYQRPDRSVEESGPVCKRALDGKLRITSPCAMLLGAVGFGAGVLAGMFGVGGGFIIVPALVSFASMGMQRAIGTSLFIITIISISGTVGHLMSGRTIPIETTTIFTAGSLFGLLLGTALSVRLHGKGLQKIFAVAILLVAVFVVLKTFAS